MNADSTSFKELGGNICFDKVRFSYPTRPQQTILNELTIRASKVGSQTLLPVSFLFLRIPLMKIFTHSAPLIWFIFLFSEV